MSKNKDIFIFLEFPRVWGAIKTDMWLFWAMYTSEVFKSGGLKQIIVVSILIFGETDNCMLHFFVAGFHS